MYRSHQTIVKLINIVVIFAHKKCFVVVLMSLQFNLNGNMFLSCWKLECIPLDLIEFNFIRNFPILRKHVQCFKWGKFNATVAVYSACPCPSIRACCALFVFTTCMEVFLVWVDNCILIYTIQGYKYMCLEELLWSVSLCFLIFPWAWNYQKKI